MLPQVHQCLLFIMPKGAVDNLKKVSCSDDNSFKACVLLPTFVIRNSLQVLQLFTRHHVEVINNRKCLPLQHALENDHVEIVELHVEDLNQTGTSELKAPFFFITVLTGNEAIIRCLFGRDAAVHTDLPGLFDLFFFHKPCKTIDVETAKTIRQLLTIRADINVRNPLAGTLLHLTVLRGDLIFVKLLLKHNANINAVMNDLSTPLHVAAEDEQFTIANILLRKGANIDARRKDGATSLLLAIRQGDTNMAKLLMTKGANVNIGKYDGLTPLHLAVQNGHSEIVNALLERGAIVNAEMIYCCVAGVTPLLFAIERGDPKLVKRLLECGAPLVDRIALYESVCRDGERYDEIVKLLLQYGCTVDMESISDPNFLHKAICKNYLKIVEQLLDHGTNVNKLYRYLSKDRGFINTTPLLTAIEFSEESMIQLLVKRGADVNADPYLDSNASLPVDIAIKKGKPKALEILLANGADVYHYDGCEESENLLYFAVEHNWLGLVEELLNKGFHVDGNGVHSTPPIICAAKKSSREMIQLLLSNGASVDSRGFDRETVLHAACKGDGSRLDIVKLLIQNNADVEARDLYTKATPIFVAVSKGCLKIVDELLKCGATIDGIDDQGGSPLYYAVTKGHRKIFRALLDYSFTNRVLIQKTSICRIFSISYLTDVSNYKKLKWIYEGYVTNELCFKKCAKILAYHVIKVEAAFSNCGYNGNLIESDHENLMAISGESNLLPNWYLEDDRRNKFLSDCEAEIAQLKSHRVGTSDVLFFDILTKDMQQLACYLRNPCIRRTRNLKNYQIKYPIYASILSYQFRKGTQRRNLLIRAIKIFSLLLQQFNELPRNLKEEVFNYLGNNDLEVFIYACTPADAAKVNKLK